MINYTCQRQRPRLHACYAHMLHYLQSRPLTIYHKKFFLSMYSQKRQTNKNDICLSFKTYCEYIAMYVSAWLELIYFLFVFNNHMSICVVRHSGISAYSTKYLRPTHTQYPIEICTYVQSFGAEMPMQCSRTMPFEKPKNVKQRVGSINGQTNRC